VSKRNLFVSFAESDGGHSYLAARALLEPNSVAHLIFRNTVADSLDAVAAGQANFAVVPSYNSITQWDGATLKALATGQFEIYAQVCMPTSYVLVAHKDYMTEFVNAYLTLREPAANPTPEEAAKIYTRFLTRIYVGAQAEEQYRGRLIRPDMKDTTIELSRNPLRILEEITRSELIKAMAASAPGARQSYGGYQGLPPNVSGGSINIGAAPVLSQPPVMAAMPALDALQAPAAMVAAGLLDAPGDPEGWDQPGSLGEIVSLLRKLLVLLNVYSFGSPDLPENKTQFLLVGRRGQQVPPDAIRSPAAAPMRISALVKPSLRKSSADQWLAPRRALARRARDYGFVFDRPPMLLAPGNQRVFLFEGGKPKDGVLPNPIGALERGVDWLGEMFSPPSDKDKARGSRAKDKSLRKSIERKPDGRTKDDTPEKFDVSFLGQYPTWCVDLAPGNSCWCCEEAHAEKSDEGGGVGLGPLVQFLVAGLVALTALALIILPLYCALTGACTWFGGAPTFEVPKVLQPSAPPPTAPPVEQTAPPKTAPPAATPTPAAPTQSTYPGLNGDSATAPVVTPKVEAPKPPPVFHVAFFEAKSNLTREALNALAAAAAQVLQVERTTKVRVVALGSRETDSDLWRRRLYAVKDELVRLGVPADRIRYEGTGPYVVTIRANRPQRESTLRKRFRSELDIVPDPMSGSYYP
jgi:outer membrane protein OmpA-like peptidoglycan-associated protein